MRGTGLMESKILLGADGSEAEHWWLYPSDVAGILIGQGSRLRRERVAKAHRKTLNELLSTHIGKPQGSRLSGAVDGS